MPEHKPQPEVPMPASESEVREAVLRICASDQFQNSERQKAFLTYVVEETLAGRGKDIRGKTIAQDVYDRGSESDSDNIVRVDARRLRRKLDEYYRADGAEEVLRVHIDGGGYAPRFEMLGTGRGSGAGDARPWLQRYRLAVFSAALVGVALVITSMSLMKPDGIAVSDATVDPSKGIERMALRDKSAIAVEAANLDEHSRGHLFPIGDVARQKLATTLFQEVIQLDPTYSGGYASAAHSLATLSLLAPDSDQSGQLLSRSLEMRETAIKLAPTHPWTQSAVGWSSFAEKEYDRAIEFSERAYVLAPEDGHILDFYATIAVLTGRFKEALEAADTDRPRNSTETRLAHRNLYAVASFHLGDYQGAITSLAAAVREGGPVSAFSLMYMAASHQGAGDNREAADLIDEMEATWPGFRPDLAMEKFYRDPEHALQVVRMLKDAGWRPGV